MYVSSSWAGPRLRSTVRLVLGMSLGLVAMVPNLLDLSSSRMIPYAVVGSVLVVALLVVSIATLRSENYSRHAWMEVAPSLFLVGLVICLCVPLWVSVGVWGAWSGDIIVIGFVIYYLAELRSIVRSHPAWYAGFAIGGIVVFISLAMADVEAAAANRQITNAGEAMFWAAAQVFRAGVLVNAKPVTAAGEVLGLVVILTSVFLAAVVFSAITAWAVRQGATRDRKETQGDALRESVMEALREAGVIVPEPAQEVSTPRLWIDVDWIAGTRRGTWWVARHASAAEVLALLESAPDVGEGRGVVAVVHGHADREWDIESADAIQVEVTGDVAALVVAQARRGDVVVTARPGLVDELAEADVEVQAPNAFMGRLAQEARGTA